MQITESWLNNHHACGEATEWVVNQPIKDEIKLLEWGIKNEREDLFAWANWYISRRLNKARKVKYAIFCAALVLDIFERTS